MNDLLRIAVADDEPDMRDYYQTILPRLGYRVVAVAENGKELVQKCQTTHPDLVITDIEMPEMDGIEAAIAIHQSRPVPVILVSAYHDPEIIRRAKTDRIVGYLVKPVRSGDLAQAIAIALRRFADMQMLENLSLADEMTTGDNRIVDFLAEAARRMD